MTMVWTVVGAVAAVAAGIALYRGGVHDGVRMSRQEVRRAVKANKPRADVDVAEQRRIRQEVFNFMQYDGSEMPSVSRGE